jgi:hypothetical protein
MVHGVRGRTVSIPLVDDGDLNAVPALSSCKVRSRVDRLSCLSLFQIHQVDNGRDAAICTPNDEHAVRTR